MKCQDALLLKFGAVLSPERLKAYRWKNKTSNEDVLTHYLWNMSLSQSFYPLLQTAEVALRNSLYFAIAQDLQDEFWLLNQHENFLHPSEEKKLIEIREKLRASRCTDIHHLS